MSLTPPEASDLQAFMMVDIAPSFHDEVLKQATMLLWLATGLAETPTDEDALYIYTQGICAMAEYLLQGAGWRLAGASPFASENIGSYSYQIGQNIRKGLDVGLMWFDQAVSFFKGLDEGSTWTSTTKVFELDDCLLWQDDAGQRYVLDQHTINERSMRFDPIG